MTKPTLDKEVEKRFEKKFKRGLYGKANLKEAPKPDNHAFPTLEGGTQTILTEIVKQFLSEELAREREKIRRNIGFLRQWLNERSDKRLLTNEDLEHWLLPDKNK